MFQFSRRRGLCSGSRQSTSPSHLRREEGTDLYLGRQTDQAAPHLQGGDHQLQSVRCPYYCLGSRSRHQVFVYERGRNDVLHGLRGRGHQGVGPRPAQDRPHLPRGTRQARPLQEHQPGSGSGN